MPLNELTYVKAARPTPKGPTARARAKKRRREDPVKRTVRAACVERDGYCRYGRDAVRHCTTPSEWAHFGDKKRARTRGMTPTDRHNTADSLMLCEAHHDDYDAGRLIITATTDAGCDGPLTYRWKERL